jgi:hypothetical protein
MRASDRLVSAQVLFSSFEEIQILARHSIPYVYVYVTSYVSSSYRLDLCIVFCCRFVLALLLPLGC